MKIKYLLSALATVAFAQNSFAQYAQDALRFSTFQPGATARIRGIGNAGTAVGGDLSSIGNNPAGLGFFTRSEFSFTPEYNGSNVKSSYLGNNMSDKRSAVNLSNASIVFHSRVNSARGADKSKGLLSFNFGVGYNRTNNFYENITYGGQNGGNSVANYYANLANSNRLPNEELPQEGTLQGIAYDQQLIDLYNSSNSYQSNVRGSVAQLSNTMRTGGQSEFNLAFGLNSSNKVYIGGSVGISSLRYNSINTFTETGTASLFENGNDVSRNFNSDFIRDQSTSGSGINVKLGMILRPVESLRIGALFTSPTWYNIDDSYSEGISTQFDNIRPVSDRQNYDFSYNLRTPLKLAGGLAYFFGKYGFISGDVEYVDYSSAKLSFNGDRDDNTEIRRDYKSVVNSRVGAEARLADSFFLRGGYGFMGNPLKNGGADMNTVSGGLGYRFQNYSLDATYTHVKTSGTVRPYDVGPATPIANLNNRFSNVYLTLGVRF
ncbi:outer membrane protein transport protein [uncultured Mucilaginibacter sp.]|uniref:OmpP1/FadL family transporter n=1 Tax=uncultured Mucilaginibacter sp. TaxID=797541 RepID=UPI0025EFEDE7|nr:outer membrane protein transport protein [uncultured Mucilaginibacter sp.]